VNVMRLRPKRGGIQILANCHNDLGVDVAKPLQELAEDLWAA